jgi:16S rRNA U1498 N3-methylase RsmE
MTREQAANVARRFGPERGWTDTPEEILNRDNHVIKLLGRIFYFPAGKDESIAID